MVNLDDFKYGGTNVTAFRLLDPEREEVKQVVQDWIFGKCSGLETRIFHSYLYERFRGYSSSLFRCLSSFMFTFVVFSHQLTLPLPHSQNTDVNLDNSLSVLFIGS